MRFPRPLPPCTSLALSVGPCLGLAGCSDDDGDGPGEEDAAFTLQLLHAADFDGATGALDNVEPFPAPLDAFRAERPDETLVLSSGDDYIPGPRSIAAEDESLAPLLGVPGPGRADIAFLNAMGFRASAVGNHDLDTGTAGFAGIVAPDDGADEDGNLAPAPYPGASFPCLSSNLDFTADEALAPLVVAPGQPGSTIPGSLTASTASTSSSRGARTRSWPTRTTRCARATPIPEVGIIATALRAVPATRDGNIVGRTSVYFDGRRTQVRTEETNLGDLTADANLWLARQLDPTVAVSLRNGGGIRSDIGLVLQPPGSNDPADVRFLPPPANESVGKAEGDISEFDLQAALRFNDGLTLLTLTAAELVEVLEHGVAATGDGATPGQFPQVGGLAFAFDPALPAREHRCARRRARGGEGRTAPRDASDVARAAVAERGALRARSGRGRRVRLLRDDDRAGGARPRRRRLPPGADRARARRRTADPRPPARRAARTRLLPAHARGALRRTGHRGVPGMAARA